MNLNFKLILDESAELQFERIIRDPAKKSVARAINKTLRLMKENLRHPSLSTHKYDEMQGPNGEEVFESYAQNKTPGAYRIFWYYGPAKKVITILAITPHP